MKKPNKQDVGGAYARLIKERRTGKSVKKGRKDGGLPTKPLPFLEFVAKPESIVLKECVDWFKKHGYGAKRMNNGAGDFGGGFRSFGIKGAGDIMVIKNGRHIEIECKKGKGGVQSKSQQKHQKWLEHNGASYLIIHDVSELDFHFLGKC